MPRPSSTSPSAATARPDVSARSAARRGPCVAGVLAMLAVLPILAVPSRAWAQACCAGGTAVTPARLALGDDYLAGATVRAGAVLGSYDTGGRFTGNPKGDAEGDFEQDLLGAVRFLRRGQAALLVPLVETERQTPQDGSHLGGGIGDVNLSARWDFFLAGNAPVVPGVALLAGVTFPTGRSPEQASPPLAVDATGVGAFQGNGGLALEQTFGPWLFDATAIVAFRTPRFGEQLGTQVAFLAAAAYTLPDDVALALSASYAFEGDAHASDGSDVPASSKRLTVVTLSTLVPLGGGWRILGGLTLDPPVDHLGSNQPASGGLTLTVIRSWS